MTLDEFGVSMSVEGVKQENYKNQNFDNPFGFTGYQSDNITNLYFAQARYYTPKIGRFNAEDSCWNHEQSSPYAQYSLNNAK